MKEALIEGVKEAGRVIVLAIIPILIDGFSTGYLNWKIVAITGVIALLRFVDKALHEMEPDGVAGGLTKF